MIATVRLSLTHVVFFSMLTSLGFMTKINGGRISRRVKEAKIFAKRSVNKHPICQFVTDIRGKGYKCNNKLSC